MIPIFVLIIIMLVTIVSLYEIGDPDFCPQNESRVEKMDCKLRKLELKLDYPCDNYAGNYSFSF